MNIDDLLRTMVEAKASDLHIKAGSPPGFRIDGAVAVQADMPPLTPENTQNLALQLMTEDQSRRFGTDRDLDFSYALKDVARFRVNALVQRGSVSLVVRQIPDVIPSVEDLDLPEICTRLALKSRGLVLVTGPTGSGKSTTLAAMIDYINRNERGHILTMEDPLEFVHTDKSCFVTQRQIGQDTATFAEALRRALRQDPDVILIGEMRDLETINMAITAAETGHLVFGTLHTTGAISTVDRIIDVFPADAQQQIRVQLATTLQGVISQTLLPRIGGGRIAAREIMVATDGIRSLIREGKTPQMLNLIQTGRSHGMITLEMALVDLVKRGLVLQDDAISKANRPEEVRRDARADATAQARPQTGGMANRQAASGTLSATTRRR